VLARRRPPQAFSTPLLAGRVAGKFSPAAADTAASTEKDRDAGALLRFWLHRAIEITV